MPNAGILLVTPVGLRPVTPQSSLKPLNDFPCNFGQDSQAPSGPVSSSTLSLRLCAPCVHRYPDVPCTLASSLHICVPSAWNSALVSSPLTDPSGNSLKDLPQEGRSRGPPTSILQTASSSLLLLYPALVSDTSLFLNFHHIKLSHEIVTV